MGFFSAALLALTAPLWMSALFFTAVLIAFQPELLVILPLLALLTSPIWVPLICLAIIF